MRPILQLGTRMSSGLVLVALVLSASISDAQVRLVRRFSFAPKQQAWSLLDLSGYFEWQALALTPQAEFLTFSARRDGIWQLYRIRNWSEEKPVIEHISLSGYFSSRDQHDLENMDVKVYVTSDGAYAVCVGTAEWLKRVGGKAVGKARMASIITVIDLKTFKIVNSKTRKPDEAFEFQSVEMDQHGQMLVTNSAFGETRHGEFVQLEVPSLMEGTKCAYNYVVDQQNSSHPIPTTPVSCEQALSGLSLEDYFKKAIRTPPRSPGFTCNDSAAEYCPEPDRFTPDGKFGMGYRTEGHDTILGSWVQTRATAIFFSVRSHAEIGEIDMTHNPSFVTLATLDGKDYLLSLRGGSELTVYQFDDSASPEISK